MTKIREEKLQKINLNEHAKVEISEEKVEFYRDYSVPQIRFSKKVMKELTEAIHCTVVVRLLTSGLGYNGLQSAIKSMWKPNGEFHIVDMENQYFLVKLDNKADYLHALFNGPWITGAHT